MPTPPSHSRRYVYHTTHLDNLEGILAHGFLSYSEQLRRGLNHHSIAASHIQDRRAKMTVPCGPGGVVHDYVPLYFTKLSPMLLAVVNAKNVDQAYLLHFAFPIAILERDDVVFTDAAANGITPPNFFHCPSDLDSLMWKAIEHRKWSSEIDGEDVKQRRMAEALVYQRLDPNDASFIVVWNESMKKLCQEIYSKAEFTTPTFRMSGPNERHTFTNYRAELPKDMLNRSIVAGPIEIHQRFEGVLDKIAEAMPTHPPPRFQSLEHLLDALRVGLTVLPETAELVGLESANGVHQDDVGTHTLKVVEKLRASQRFAALPQPDQDLLELAAYLHDIGKGPKARWSTCKGGKQQSDPDHPIRSTEMLPRILSEELHLEAAETRILCKLVCYHDLVGDIIGKGRDRNQLAQISETERELDLLIALGEADVKAIDAMWAFQVTVEIPALRNWVVEELNAKLDS